MIVPNFILWNTEEAKRVGVWTNYEIEVGTYSVHITDIISEIIKLYSARLSFIFIRGILYMLPFFSNIFIDAGN